MRILIVEDEPTLGNQLKSTLEQNGYAVDLSTDGEDGHFLGSSEDYDAVVLDLGLPEIDGLTVLGMWRREGRTFPVLVLTARDSWSDKVAGLDAGADDYLAKPFSFEELLARLRALARRPREVRMPVLTVGELQLDPAARTVQYGNTPIELTRKEFALLEALMRRPGEAVSRFDLLECAWDDSYDNRSNIVDVYIGYLRQKVDRPFGTESIETVRGFGYRLRTEETG